MPDRNEDATCSNCPYRRLVGQELQCHVRPPVITIQGGMRMEEWRYPTVSPDDWCGLHPDCYDREDQ